MKKIIFILVVLFMFAVTSFKLNAEEVVEDNVQQEELVAPEVDNEQITDGNVTPPVDNIQEEVDKVPTEIENKTKEITDYIIALVVSFLGSSTFYAIIKAITNRSVKLLNKKVKELEEQNKISSEAKQQYENKIAKLETNLNDATNKMNTVLNTITEYLEIDEKKQKQMAKLLENLLPSVEEGE